MPPLVFLHGGICTIESRGMLTPTAHFRSADRCSTIAVSERPVPSPPMKLLSPSRVSEPRMRMLTGLCLTALARALRRRRRTTRLAG